MTDINKKQKRKSIEQVSLASYMQMIEQEGNSCTVVVTKYGEMGQFFFLEGVLMDAEYREENGITAAHMLLNIDNPEFGVAIYEDRDQNINQSVTQILLKSTAHQDEMKHRNQDEKPAVTSPVKAPATAELTLQRKLIKTLSTTNGIKHFCVLDRRSKLIAQSQDKTHIVDFITYAINSGVQIRKALESKTLSRIRFTLEDGSTLIIISSKGMIIGLILEKDTSETTTIKQLLPVLANR